MASGVSRFNIRTWGKVMELTPLYRCVAALDVHQAKLTVCVLRGEADGELSVALREFGGFKRDRREMVRWVASFARSRW